MYVLVYLSLQGLSLWLYSLKCSDSSLFDRFWGLSFVVITWMCWYNNPSTLQGHGVLLLVNIWGLRLSWHITRRNWNKGEDRRYAAMRSTIKGYWWRSAGMVFGFQSFLVLVVSYPLQVGYAEQFSNSMLWQSVGFGLWVTGFSIEMIADGQLKKFISQRQHPEQVCCSGLWAMSRHPNYVGEAILWWGFAFMAFSLSSWWILVSPIVMTWLLRYFTGVGPLEQELMLRKPNYREYMKTVPIFWPKLRILNFR
jgi:steroid 5-alpha reductase family enzyme